MTVTPQTTTVDVRTTIPCDRHALIFGAFAKLLHVWQVRIDRVAAWCD
jgi:uncharacterized protein (DUF2249 family)